MKKEFEKISFSNIFLSKDKLARDIVVVTLTAVLAYLLKLNHRQINSKQKDGQQKSEQPVSAFFKEAARQREYASEIRSINLDADTAQWEEYASQWYGFELKYPKNWQKPKIQKAFRNSKWEYRYQFRKAELEGDSVFAGFDVTIYDVGKVRELSATEEFPAVKNEELKSNGLCEDIPGHMAENENYPAEEIYISPTDDCLNQAFFYSLIREKYIYNIVPVVRENQEIPADLKNKSAEDFPEFFSVVSSFDLIEIARPKPVPRKPKINAPKPVGTTKRDSQGRRVCAKKSDHPGKSKAGKKKHLDMECCLDPDEYPNPHCYYPESKYGKYL